MSKDDDSLPDYMTPLYFAVTRHDFEKARDLISTGQAVDLEPTEEGHTLLHRAVQHGDIEAVRFLLSSGCPGALNGFDYVQHTPLIWAAKEGRLEIARLLLSAKADVNAHNEERIGNTAIREAAHSGDLRMVELLLSAGADPAIPGWMQIDAILEARIQAEDDPTSEVRRKILVILENAPPRKGT